MQVTCDALPVESSLLGKSDFAAPFSGMVNPPVKRQVISNFTELAIHSFFYMRFGWWYN